MRTNKGMTFSDTRKATPGAVLRCVPGINFSDSSLALNLVADHIEDHATRPNREPSIPCLASMLSLFKIQILKHKNTILGSPLNELLRCTMTEILSPASSPTLQPFEGSNNAPGISSLCLMLSKLSLKSLDCLRCALVLDFSIQATYEKLVSVCINSYDSISLIQVNSYRMNTWSLRKFNRVGNVSDNLISKILDYNAINFSSIAEVLSEYLRNRILKVLAAIDCRNAQEPILSETCIPSPRSDKEKSERVMPVERMLQLMTILLSRSISSGSQPNACASELTGNVAFHVIVNSTMQIQSFQRLAEVPCSFRYAVAYLSKAIDGIDERFIFLDNYLQSSLSKHQWSNTTMTINKYLLSGGDWCNSSPA